MNEVEKLYDELNIQTDPINIKFNVDDYQFWLNKRGLLRKKVAASRFLVSYYTDEFGVMEGKYDATIDHLLNGVSLVASDDQTTDMSNGHFWDWVETLPAEDDEGNLIQSMMIETLPQAVAAVIVGKPELTRILRKIMTLAEHTESPESQNTTNDQGQQELPKKSKEPVRTSPKAANPSG